ncbi:EI24 domain-containing protein [Rhodobacteraceae bacterium NNCM2]|nr:EI24 domain-containing protein [Coraliihabitans acroporae]
MALINDFLRAIGQMTDKRFLNVLLMALGLTIGLLIAITALAAWSMSLLPDPLFTLPWIGAVSLPLSGLQGLAVGGMVLASAFLMFPVAAVFVGMFLDQIADAVEARYYPGAGATRRAGIIEGLTTGLGFAAVVVIANLVALIVYLILPPFAPLIFIAMNGYLLGREFFQLVAVRHIGPRDAEALRRRYWLRVWIAGMLMAIPLAIPILNLVIPVLGVATITHQYHRLASRNT